MTNRNTLISLLLILILVVLGMIFRASRTTESPITNFIECKNAGYPIMESYPAQCRDGSGKNFVENIADNEVVVPSEKTLDVAQKESSHFRTQCESAGGTWSNHYNGCLGVENSNCENIGGKFDPCAANCSNTPDGEVCTNGCLRICRM